MIFRFSTGSRFGFQNASKMRSPGIPKLEKVVSGISSFLGVVFGSTFDEKWPQKGTSKSIRNMSIRCFLADPLPGGAPGFIFDRFLIDFWWFWDRFLSVCLMIFMHGMPCFYLFSFAFTIGFRGYCCGIDVWFLQYWCGMMWNFLWCCWGIAVILLWRDCGISVIAVWIPTILLWYCCEIALVLLWSCCGFPMVAVGLKFGGAGDCCGIDVGFMWNSCGIDVESPETLLGIAVILLW